MGSTSHFRTESGKYTAFRVSRVPTPTSPIYASFYGASPRTQIKILHNTLGFFKFRVSSSRFPNTNWTFCNGEKICGTLISRFSDKLLEQFRLLTRSTLRRRVELTVESLSNNYDKTVDDTTPMSTVVSANGLKDGLDKADKCNTACCCSADSPNNQIAGTVLDKNYV